VAGDVSPKKKFLRVFPTPIFFTKHSGYKITTCNWLIFMASAPPPNLLTQTAHSDSSCQVHWHSFVDMPYEKVVIPENPPPIASYHGVTTTARKRPSQGGAHSMKKKAAYEKESTQAYKATVRPAKGGPSTTTRRARPASGHYTDVEIISSSTSRSASSSREQSDSEQTSQPPTNTPQPRSESFREQGSGPSRGSGGHAQPGSSFGGPSSTPQYHSGGPSQAAGSFPSALQGSPPGSGAFGVQPSKTPVASGATSTDVCDPSHVVRSV
jgi:hypothetical protein